MVQIKENHFVKNLITVPALLFIATFSVTLTVYLLTLSPGVVGGDAGEYQFAVPILGIPHATGYPLYTLLGKLWTLLIPIGSMAWRMNLLSAFGGATAAATTSIIVYRLTTPKPSATSHVAGSFIAGLTLALGLTFWQWSIIAGVRSINILFFALLTLEAIVWQQQLQMKDDKAAERTLRWLALTVGLSLAHHRTTIFYLPSIIAWVWWHDRQLITQPKRVFTLTTVAIAPLFLYLFTYFRGISNPPYSHETITDLKSLWFLIGAEDSSGLFFSIDPNFLPDRLLFIWNDILAQVSWVGVGLALLGAVILVKHKPAHFLFQGLLVLFLLLFTLDFEVVKLNEAPTWYLMPAYFIFAIWLGLGSKKVIDFGFRYLYNSPFVPLYLLVIVVYFIGYINWQRIYQDSIAPLDEWRQLLRGKQAQRLVESSLPYIKPDSLILGDWEQYTPFLYYKLVNNQRTDVTYRQPLNLWQEKVNIAHKLGQPVYLTRATTDLIGTPYLSMAGSLIYLGTEPEFTPPNDIISLEANFENELELIGYKAKVIPQRTVGSLEAKRAKPKPPESILQLFLYWRVPHSLEWDYALSFRLLDSEGTEVYKKDVTHPVLSSYPTTLWTLGEVVTDFYELPLIPNEYPPFLPLTLHLLPYRTEGVGQWHNLTLTDTKPLQEGIFLGPFEAKLKK